MIKMTTANPRITAIICTYNRCRLLADALESLAAQSLEPAQFEIVVVDNASQDETATVVARFQSHVPHLRVRLIREESQGLSRARNAGFRAARGEYVAYLDDDAIAAPIWLEAGLQAFDSAQPKPLAVVGPVLPRYPDGKPAWFNDRFETFHLGDAPVRLTSKQSFMGGNAMFARQTLERLGGFNPQLGMTGGRLWLGEEIELLRQMRRTFGSDCCVYYDPRVSILHAIPRQKLRVGYVLRRRFLNGQCTYLMRAEERFKARASLAAQSLAWIGWLSFSAIVFAYRHRSVRSWLAERGAPIAVHLGRLTACLRHTSNDGVEPADADAGIGTKPSTRKVA